MAVTQNADMSKKRKPNHHLKAWREFRSMTQEQLAEKVGTSKGVISDLENENRGLSTKWLMRLAPVLKTSPGAILDYDPEEIPTGLIEIWLDMSEASRPQAIQVLKTFPKRTGTND